ncbi:hypothetical protein ENTCAN_09481 [Enterobacter cancerogenus ATCC 35316]|nr:hypothetical protein ENTCAN_09481 [Enterobacter cancerogenus ATCC 35316]
MFGGHGSPCIKPDGATLIRPTKKRSVGRVSAAPPGNFTGLVTHIFLLL